MLDDILKVKDLSAANSNMLRELIRYHAIDVGLEAPLLSVALTMWSSGLRMAKK